MLTEREEGANEPSTLFIGSARASTMKTVMAAFDGKVNKPGDWEGLYNEEKKLLMVKYYDFDRNIRQKTIMSNGLDHMLLLSRFMMSKAAFAFCDKYYKGLHQRSWPHKHGDNYRPGDFGHQPLRCPVCFKTLLPLTLKLTWLTLTKCIDFRDNCLALADEIYAYYVCTLKD